MASINVDNNNTLLVCLLAITTRIAKNNRTIKHIGRDVDGETGKGQYLHKRTRADCDPLFVEAARGVGQLLGH